MSKWGRLGIFMCLLLVTQVWASIGKVSLLKGEAAASRDNQTIKLSTNSHIEEHDMIVTSNNSQIQLTFEDKTVITLGSSSVLDIQEYLNDAQQPKAKFKFNQGTFKSITGEIGKKAPENFNLETKTATIGIRGTTVAGSAGYENGQNYVSLLSDSDGGVGQIVITNHGGTQILNQAGPLQFSSSFAPPPPPPVRPDLIGCYSGAIVVTNPHGSVPVSAGSFTIVSLNFAPTPPAPLTPAQLQQLNQPLSPSAQSQGSSAPSQATAQTPAITAAPPVVEQASQTSQLANTYTHFTNQIDNYSDSFYPVFSPTLQSSSTHAGTVTLSGLATSKYLFDGIANSIEDTLTLSLDTSNDSISSGAISLYREVSEPVSLIKAANSATMTYKDINRFAIKNFDNQAGWMQTDNTYANDYVSWGYWAMKVNDDSTLLPTMSYWVAGKDAASASAYVTTKIGDATTTNYTYNGHVIGSVIDGGNSYNIDPTTNNAIALNFDFGGGCGSLSSGSIQFQTSQTTPQVWSANLFSTSASGSGFAASEGEISINGTPSNTSITSVKGQFYGSSAQAVGGTFKLKADSQTAIGVFKAVK
ncbi:FecR domain-containing protein [Sulfurospirillum oryzae]|uniref:FecR domain-containing protein n=1 Tax=Sulfurospirillum oryzae TaxID=2976535 RepID=UPI0021E83876|nr:FecR domain-containing protein [Sulfurospirillum oryzae]